MYFWWRPCRTAHHWVCCTRPNYFPPGVNRSKSRVTFWESNDRTISYIIHFDHYLSACAFVRCTRCSHQSFETVDLHMGVLNIGLHVYMRAYSCTCIWVFQSLVKLASFLVLKFFLEKNTGYIYTCAFGVLYSFEYFTFHELIYLMPFNLCVEKFFCGSICVYLRPRMHAWLCVYSRWKISSRF